MGWKRARVVMAASGVLISEFVAHDSAPSVTGLNYGLAAGLNTPLSGPLVAVHPKAPLSFVVCDPKRKSGLFLSPLPECLQKPIRWVVLNLGLP
jgi:hypothetical protein